MRQPVVDFSQRFHGADARTREIADILKASMAKVTSIADVLLQHSTAGLVVAAGGTVSVEGTNAPLDLSDATVDSVRLIVRGKTAAAGPITLQAYDLTNSVVLATVTVTAVNATNIGAWTPVVLKGGDREVVLRVVGDTVNAQTLYNARLQMRTVRFNA